MCPANNNHNLRRTVLSVDASARKYYSCGVWGASEVVLPWYLARAVARPSLVNQSASVWQSVCLFVPVVADSMHWLAAFSVRPDRKSGRFASGPTHSKTAWPLSGHFHIFKCDSHMWNGRLCAHRVPSSLRSLLLLWATLSDAAAEP